MMRVLLLLAAVLATPASAQSERELLGAAALDVSANAALPLDAEVVDAAGKRVALGTLLQEAPALVVPVDLDCQQLCGLTLADLMAALRELPPADRGFRTLVLSIDPREGPADIARVLDERGSAEAWPERAMRHVVGVDGSQARITDALGFTYRYDEASDQFVHPAAVAAVGADGGLRRWLTGYPFEARDIRLAMSESGDAGSLSLVQRVALTCYRYDPTTGRYTLAVDRIVRTAGTGTALLLAACILVLLARERRARARSG